MEHYIRPSIEYRITQKSPLEDSICKRRMRQVSVEKKMTREVKKSEVRGTALVLVKDTGETGR